MRQLLKENITGWPHGFRFQSCVRYAEIRCIGNMVQTADKRMEDEPPTQMMLQPLTACTQVDTCLPRAACIPFFHMLELHALPLPGLRIKTCLSHSFGIIINYYSQGLKPLRLAPLSNLSSPFPLPTLWKLSPPSLFLRGRSARNDV
jgi:hypothetical protein